MEKLTIKLKVAWWVSGYVRAVEVFAYLFGVEPDPDKVAKALTYLGGIKVEVE